MRVLLVEDDPGVARAVADGLSGQGVQLKVAASCADGARCVALNDYDALVLDIMLPDGSGLDLCRRLRADGIVTPILLLTARAAVDDRVAGLDAGADDYLTKPFALAELAARLRALVRRRAGLLPERYVFHDLKVDLKGRVVRRAERPIELTNKEWDLLELFVRHRGNVLGRAEITAYVWDENHDPMSNALEVLVRRLRAKIDDGFAHKTIATVRGAGYRFGA